MKRSLILTILALAVCCVAHADRTYSINLNLTQPEFVGGGFTDEAIFSTVGTNPVTVSVAQIISFSGGGSGRGGGYRPGIRRYLSLSSAAVYDANTFTLVGNLTGTTTSLSGTFNLPAGIYYVEISGTGTGTNGAGEYGVTVRQTPPSTPPSNPPPNPDPSDD